MRLEPAELNALAEDLAARIVPRIVAELRQQLKETGSANDGRLIGIDDLAKEITLSAGTIRARVKDGTLPAITVGRRVLFDLANVKEALQNRPRGSEAKRS